MAAFAIQQAQRNIHKLEKHSLDFYKLRATLVIFIHKQLSKKLINWIAELGFKAPKMREILDSPTEIEEFYKRMLSVRDDFEMLLDGMVIKVDSVPFQDELGYTVKTVCDRGWDHVLVKEHANV
mgnify:CR=1 FL=1